MVKSIHCTSTNKKTTKLIYCAKKEWSFRYANFSPVSQKSLWWYLVELFDDSAKHNIKWRVAITWNFKITMVKSSLLPHFCAKNSISLQKKEINFPIVINNSLSNIYIKKSIMISYIQTKRSQILKSKRQKYFFEGGGKIWNYF
jgi:hypothetical protein